MWKPAKSLKVSSEQRDALEQMARSRTAEQRVVLRARIVLAAAEGKPNRVIASDLNVSRPTVLHWRTRFLAGGVEALRRDAPRPGRPRRIDGTKVESIVTMTLRTTPKAATQWSTRSLAAEQGVSRATVQRIWKAHGLQPHRV